MKSLKFVSASVGIFLITGILISPLSHSQTWGGQKPTDLWSDWSVNLSGGLTSYFGDLSLHDFEVGAKLSKESGPAMSIILTKHIFRNAVGLSGQVMAGSLEGRKSSIAFKTELFEYNLHARIDFVNLFDPQKNHTLGIAGYAGIGQFIFSTVKVVGAEGILEKFSHDSHTPEFVFFFGGGFHYKISDQIGLTADLALRQCRNDRLDDYIINDDFDYYSFLSVGITYQITSLKHAPIRNKARLANTSFLFSLPAHPAH